MIFGPRLGNLSNYICPRLDGEATRENLRNWKIRGCVGIWRRWKLHALSLSLVLVKGVSGK